jgi:hypothetical protein
MNIVFFAILKLFIIVSFGFYFYKKKIIGEEALKFLTFLVINISVPFLIFTKIVKNLDTSHSPSLLSFLFLSLLMFLVGIIVGGILALFVPKQIRREFMSLVGFQNCGYLPMNIALFLFSPILRDEFLIYIFLYILGFNILLWSVGSFFIFKRKGEKFNVKSIFTAPMVSIIISLIFVYTGLKDYLPQFIFSPLKIIGEMSFPLSMIILGAWLAKGWRGRIASDFKPILKVVIGKLGIIPLVFFLGVLKLKLFSLFGLFIIMEASMPSAASLPIVVNLRGGNSEFVSRGIFFTHLVSIATVPIWLEIFIRFSGYSF